MSDLTYIQKRYPSAQACSDEDAPSRETVWLEFQSLIPGVIAWALVAKLWKWLFGFDDLGNLVAIFFAFIASIIWTLYFRPFAYDELIIRTPSSRFLRINYYSLHSEADRNRYANRNALPALLVVVPLYWFLERDFGPISAVTWALFFTAGILFVWKRIRAIDMPQASEDKPS